MAECLKVLIHALKSALDSNLIPAKYCVSLRKLHNHSVLQIMGITMVLNYRVLAGIEEVILVKSLFPALRPLG